MNKTGKWIITGLCVIAGTFITIQMAVNGYVIYKLDNLTVKVARLETMLDMHMHALAEDPPLLTNSVSSTKQITTHKTIP